MIFCQNDLCCCIIKRFETTNTAMTMSQQITNNDINNEKKLYTTQRMFYVTYDPQCYGRYTCVFLAKH